MDEITVGFAMTGSYCTFAQVFPQLEKLCENGYKVYPIMSENVQKTDTRFGKAADFIKRAEEITGNRLLKSIPDVEPIGPKKLTDALIVAPCTGNTLAKLANGITDTTVTMAVKSTLRNNKPIIIAVSTNDGLANSAKNIGHLLNYKNIYFVPFKQDDPYCKERSLVADMDKINETLINALSGKQEEPIIK
ncbi:MAG: dipicolinate synthase subunit B [Clostridia bacterium]|nr:dipicolinate synthase subunit B [Clostridia bacterium]